MKAITIWQPWAGAVAEGIKENETRSWYTKYRGPIAIHAAQLAIQIGWARYAGMEAKEVICRRMELPEIFNGPNIFPSGVILATANLVDCIKITKEYVAALSADELALGDYTLDRYAWKLAEVKKFPEPIPAKGRQGLWEWEEGEKMNKMQDIIVKFIIAYYKEHRFYPSYEEIAEGVGGNKSTVYTYMVKLEREGIILRKAERSPQYRLINMEFILKNEAVE